MHLDCGCIREISVLQDSTVFHLDDLNGHSERALLLVGYESCIQSSLEVFDAVP